MLALQTRNFEIHLSIFESWKKWRGLRSSTHGLHQGLSAPASCTHLLRYTFYVSLRFLFFFFSVISAKEWWIWSGFLLVMMFYELGLDILHWWIQSGSLSGLVWFIQYWRLAFELISSCWEMVDHHHHHHQNSGMGSVNECFGVWFSLGWFYYMWWKGKYLFERINWTPLLIKIWSLISIIPMSCD